MKKLLFLIILCSLPIQAQTEVALFSDAIKSNYSKFKWESIKAYQNGDFVRGQFLFDSLVKNQLVGSKFNEYTFNKTNNRKLKIAKLKKPIFLITYSSWCIPSKGEIPALNKLAKKHHKDVEFVVLIWGDKKEAKKFTRKFNGKIDICYADKKNSTDAEIVENMRETLGFPTTYVLNANLNILDIKRGSAQPSLDTPEDEAIDMNYRIFKDRIAGLLFKDDIQPKKMLADF